MRLITRLAVAFLVLVVLTISLHELLAFDAHRRDFERDLERSHRLVAASLADAVESVAQHEGIAAARRTLAAARGELAGELAVRWVCAPDGVPDAPPPAVDCAALAAAPNRIALGHGATRRLVSWAPVHVAGRGAGSIEVSETPRHEEEWVGQRLAEALRLAVSTVFAMTLASFALGWWLVAIPTRRLREKARAVGRGELEPDLVLDRRDELAELADEMNAMCRRLAAARDETARESAARVAAVERLQHANRLATIGRLASGLAHELGTPLNVIQARADLITESDAADEASRESARVIVRCTEQVTGIVGQLLAFARPRTLELRPLRVDHVARSVVDLLQPLANRRGVALAAPSLDPATAIADGVLVQQALMNLVVNGLWACRAGGHVTLSTGPARRAGPSGGPERPWARISVGDDGIGITPEVRASLFEPFFTTRPPGEGTGLGLPIVAGILDDHGGFLEVDSEPGRGSTFHVFLPVDPAKEVP